MKLFLKGILIGIGKIIPGFSGAVVAITLGVYEKMLISLSHPIKNIQFLIKISLGIVFGVFLFSYIINYLLDNYYPHVMLFFIGLISGGIPLLFEKTNNKYTFNNFFILIISFFVLIFITFLSDLKMFKNQNSIYWFIMGVLEAISTIIPGISGTAILSIFDAYKPLIESINNINLNILFNFGIGIFLGIICLIKLISFMFEKHNEKMYFMIIGLSIASIVTLIINVLSFNVINNLNMLVLNILLFTVGYLIGNKLDE